MLRSARFVKGRAVAAAVGLMLAGAAGCGGDPQQGSDRVKVGLLVSLSGTYQSVGTDMRDGFLLYLELHGGTFGGRDVDLIIADEGDGAPTAVPAATKLVQSDGVVAIAGVVGGGSVAGIVPLLAEYEVPLIGSNARPNLPDPGWVWTTSFLSDEPGRAVAGYVQEHVDGPVFAIGPDYQGGHDELRGFTDEFARVGGVLANPSGETLFTPFPATTNFLPYFSQIRASGAKAVYAFYAGKAAIDFVTQYRRSDIADLPLYGAFLTEGSVLQAQGDDALGILNVLNYSPDLDYAENRTFVAEWTHRYPGRQPTTFAMASFDAAAVLDIAIGSIDGEVTSRAVNDALATVGELYSPRGPWQFNVDTHAPVQRWYLREVRYDGQVLANTVVEELATLGQS
jgi:branched-chain amino acid transport system substrate-binding protein